MSAVVPAVELFESRIREALPELASSLVNAAPDGFGNLLLLDAPWPTNPSRCRLEVFYRRSCVQVDFSVAETRGPAEAQIDIEHGSAGGIEATIEFLRDFVSGQILVDVVRFRHLWFQPYYLSFFRAASSAPRGRVMETLRWKGGK